MRTTKGIRGAITVDENSLKSIKNATLELFQELIKQNNLEEKFVSHVIFTATKDLTAVYPAKFIRQDIGWNNTAFMCMQEMNVEIDESSVWTLTSDSYISSLTASSSSNTPEY